MRVLGWDVGGAHLKAALSVDARVRRVWQLPTPLWRDLSALEAGLTAISAQAGPVDRHALTMTGELTDVFADRAEGVQRILQTCEAQLRHPQIAIYAHPSRWLRRTRARHTVSAVASANWSVTATWLGYRLRDALFLDVGSTTTDLIPIVGGKIAARGVSDWERLRHDELVYTGVTRTPVMAMAERVPYQGHWVTPMAEVFATSADVYRVLGLLPEGVDLLPSADGRDKTPDLSARRLARMLGVDVESVAPMRDCARFLVQAQTWRLEQALLAVMGTVSLPPQAPLVGAGIGRFLVRQLAKRAKRPYQDLSDLLPASPLLRAPAADCAPAACVALLASG